MGLELTTKFHDDNWYYQNIDKVKSMIKKLPSYLKQVGNDEFWLKDSLFKNSWEFDVRIFATKESLLVEVSSFSRAFTEDVKILYNEILQCTNVSLIDDDGEIYNWNR